MRLLFDNCVDRKFKHLLAAHEVFHARDKGWMSLSNGDLLSQAEKDGFDALVTVDKNLQYQQNIKGRSIRVIILNSQRVTYPHIAPLAEKLLLALKTMQPGAYLMITP